ncbi:MAG: hypothetical protein KH301_03135 [Brachyspira sp.]|nr:hypothetical protein [Brachyspira sp.]
MRKLMQIMAYLAILGVMFLVILNVRETITLQVWGPKFDASANMVYHLTKTLNVAFYTVCVMLAGLFAGVALTLPFYFAELDKISAYRRELERRDVKSDSSTSKVRVLEAKVEVLEKALRDALGR